MVIAPRKRRLMTADEKQQFKNLKFDHEGFIRIPHVGHTSRERPDILGMFDSYPQTSRELFKGGGVRGVII